MEKLNLNELSDAMVFDAIEGPCTASLMVAVAVATISGSFDGCTGLIFKFSISLTGKSNWNDFPPNVDVNDFFTKNDLVGGNAVAFGAVDVLFLLASAELLLAIN